MRKLEELLEDYKSGLLSPEEEQFLVQKLEEDPSLRKEAEGYAAAWEVVRHKVNIDTKEKLKAQLMEDGELRERYEEELKRQLEEEPIKLDVEKEKKIVQENEEKSWHPGYSIAAGLAFILAFFFVITKFTSAQKPEDMASTKEALKDSTYKYFYKNQLAVRKGNRGSGDTIKSQEFKETDSTLFKLFDKDSLKTVISYLSQKSTTKQLWPKDSLFLAIAYYHTGAYKESTELLEKLADSDKKRWYLARNYIQLQEYESGKRILCEMQTHHNFQRERVETLLANFKFSCP